MDIHKAIAHESDIDERIKLAKDYAKEREEAFKAKYKLDMLLVANLSEIRGKKSNVGYDMALLMLMEIDFLKIEDTNAVREYYKDYLYHTSRYKGLERILSSFESKTTFYQSLMRYQREGEK